MKTKKRVTATEFNSAFDYINWLYNSGRLTFVEHAKLHTLVEKLESDTIDSIYRIL